MFTCGGAEPPTIFGKEFGTEFDILLDKLLGILPYIPLCILPYIPLGILPYAPVLILP